MLNLDSVPGDALIEELTRRGRHHIGAGRAAVKIVFGARSRAGKGRRRSIRFVPQRPAGEARCRAVSEAEFSGEAERAALLARRGDALRRPRRAREDRRATLCARAAGAAAMFLKKIGQHAGSRWRSTSGRSSPVRPSRASCSRTTASSVSRRRRPTPSRACTCRCSPRIWPRRSAPASAARRSPKRPISRATSAICPATCSIRRRSPRAPSKLARDFGLKVTVFDEKKLRAGKFGGLLAVGQGSVRGPRLIVLEHRGGPKSAGADRARRQGDHLRHRRHFHQAGGEHGGHDLRQMRRHGRARRDGRDRRARREAQRRRHHRQRGKHARRQRLSPRRHRHDLRRQAHRDRQHRRRGPRGPRRRHRLRAPGSARPPRSSISPRSPARAASRSANTPPGFWSSDDAFGDACSPPPSAPASASGRCRFSPSTKIRSRATSP